MKENTKFINHIRILAKQHDVPCISGETEHFLSQHLMKYKPMNCLEIGTAVGCSTMLIASTIDQWQGQLQSFEISHPSYMTALLHQRTGAINNVTLYYADFLEVPIERLLTYKDGAPNKLDFVFVDGAKAHYHLYLEKILPYCSPHATIVCDDVIAFTQKVDALYQRLDKHNITYSHIPAEQGDGLLLVTLNN